MNAPLIAVEGLDGTGKSALADALARRLGAALLTTPDPALRAVRTLVDERWDADARTLFYAGSVLDVGRRAAALAATGTPVVIDRYWATTLAYAVGLGLGEVLAALGVRVPPVWATVYVTAPRPVRVARLNARGASALDREALQRDARIARAYETALARPFSGAVLRVDNGEVPLAASVEAATRALSERRLAAPAA
jgi:thymidylate kinase